MYAKLLVVCFVAVAGVQASPNRVIAGHNANKGQYPYQISLQYGYSLVHQHVCGGSVLNKRWVLTAGHCITEVPHMPLAHYYVKAGVTNLDEKGQVVQAKSTIVHPDYKGGVNPNDIALIELQEDLQMNDLVQPVNLPEAGAIPTGPVTLTGWGSTSTNMIPKYPKNLQTVDLAIVSFEDCKKMLEDKTGQSDPLVDTNVCTGVMRRTDAGACSGDSGGPLVANKDKPTQIGIVSWGMIPCGSDGLPSVFTRVSAFMDFINQHVKN